VNKNLSSAIKQADEFFFFSAPMIFGDMVSKGIKFVREPKTQDYGTVAVFEDLYGNLWDLLEFSSNHPLARR
jgi:uncharacterized glyoxalase superfamily protein PhnB